jgi:hypothetical protein
VTIPQAFEAGQVMQQARRQPGAGDRRTGHTDDEVDYLSPLGAVLTMGEREIAHRMIERGLQRRRTGPQA